MRAILLLCLATACSSTSENPGTGGTAGATGTGGSSTGGTSSGGSSTGGSSTGGTAGGGSGGVSGAISNGGTAGVAGSGGFGATGAMGGSGGGVVVDCDTAFLNDLSGKRVRYCVPAGCASVTFQVTCDSSVESPVNGTASQDSCSGGGTYFDAAADFSKCTSAKVDVTLNCPTETQGTCLI